MLHTVPKEMRQHVKGFDNALKRKKSEEQTFGVLLHIRVYNNQVNKLCMSKLYQVNLLQYIVYPLHTLLPENKVQTNEK